jgi:hypothetical protein
MGRPQIADEGHGLQIWRVAANIFNKQPRTADKGWSSSLGLGMGLTTPHGKKEPVKLSLYLINYAPRHKDVCGRRGMAPPFLTSALYDIFAALPPRERAPGTPWIGRLGGCGPCGGNK